MKRLIVALAMVTTLTIELFAVGSPGIKRASRGGGGDGNATTGDLTLNTSSGNFLSVSGSQTVTGGANLKVSSFTSIGTVSSTSGFVGGGSTITSIRFGDGSIQSAAASSGVDLTASTQTKTGGATFGGSIGVSGAAPVANSITFNNGSNLGLPTKIVTIAQHPTSGTGTDLEIIAGPAKNNAGGNTSGGNLLLKSGNVSGQGTIVIQFWIGKNPGAVDGVDRATLQDGQWNLTGLVIGSVGDGPNVKLDVRGVIHSSDSAHFAIGGGSVTIGNTTGGTNNPPPTKDSKFSVINGSITVRGTNSGLEVKAGTVTFQRTALYFSSITFNAATPPPGTAIIFSSSTDATTDMYVKDSAGNQTIISPHDDNGEWVFYSVNTNTGKVVFVPMERMIADLEKLTGKKYLYDEYMGHEQKTKGGK